MTMMFETRGAAPPATTPAEPRAAAAAPRLDSVDLLRGLVMVIMALDHTRDFFGASGMNPRDVTDPALFLTRWITHFCAPVFIFLAGMSAWLYGMRGRSPADVSWFLLTRGLWLIVIEFTVVRLGWSFAFDINFFVTQVIFAIGASMVVLAGLVHLPGWAIATIALAMIGGHNLLDGIKAADFGPLGFVWNVLHQPGLLPVTSSIKLFVLYPLIPWVGVMAAGYALGPVLTLNPGTRARVLVGLGSAITAGFFLLRLSNLYGDPASWVAHESAFATFLSLLNCEKYPPSLLYLMMTLGPALILLAAFEHARGRLAGFIITIGRVPFLYYVAHIFLIHALAVGFAYLTMGNVGWLFGGPPGSKPAGYGLPLPGIYAVWLMVVAMLYPLCRWFAALKQRRGEWWWSYL